jgi:glycosyltransferase involved in cell wall biosynthesis
MAALAAGRPVVVTKTGAMPEVVEEGKTGFVVPPGDAAALAGAISRLLEKPEMAARMGREASEHARRDFSWDSIAGRTIDLYRSMAGAHACAPATR